MPAQPNHADQPPVPGSTEPVANPDPRLPDLTSPSGESSAPGIPVATPPAAALPEANAGLSALEGSLSTQPLEPAASADPAPTPFQPAVNPGPLIQPAALSGPFVPEHLGSAGSELSSPAQTDNLPSPAQAEEGQSVAQEAALGSDNGDASQPKAPGPGAVTSSEPSAAPPQELWSESLLTPAELRQARLKHDQFTRTLSTRLSIYLRTEFSAQVTALQVLSHPKFMAALPDPAHFALFRLEPMSGLGVLAMPLRLSLALADRLLGGPGHREQTDCGPTEVERAVLDLLTTQLLREWSQTVLGRDDAQPHILGHETHRRFLCVSPAAGQFMHLVAEAQLGQVTEPFHLGVPFAMIESVFRQAQPCVQPPQPLPGPAAAEPLQWHPGLEEIPVTITAGWDGLRLTAEQLANLKVGDWLPLEPHRFNQVHVRLARQPKFVGRLGATNRTRAIELIGPIESL